MPSPLTYNHKHKHRSIPLTSSWRIPGDSWRIRPPNANRNAMSSSAKSSGWRLSCATKRRSTAPMPMPPRRWVQSMVLIYDPSDLDLDFGLGLTFVCVFAWVHKVVSSVLSYLFICFLSIFLLLLLLLLLFQGLSFGCKFGYRHINI